MMRLIGKDVGACLQAIQCVVTMRTILIACKQAPTRNIGSSHLERELELEAAFAAAEPSPSGDLSPPLFMV
jgi:hypothetical protein